MRHNHNQRWHADLLQGLGRPIYPHRELATNFFDGSILRNSWRTECAHFPLQAVKPLQFRFNCRGALFPYLLGTDQRLLGDAADFVQ